MQKAYEMWVQSPHWEDLLEGMEITPVSGLKNPMDREAWWATVHGVTKNWIQLSDYFFHFMIPQCPIAPKWGRHDLNPGSSASIASVFGV